MRNRVTITWLLVAVSFLAPVPIRNQRLAITHVTVIDATGSAPRNRHDRRHRQASHRVDRTSNTLSC